MCFIASILKLTLQSSTAIGFMNGAKLFRADTAIVDRSQHPFTAYLAPSPSKRAIKPPREGHRRMFLLRVVRVPTKIAISCIGTWWIFGIDAQAFGSESFVGGEVALAPVYVAIAFECQDVCGHGDRGTNDRERSRRRSQQNSEWPPRALATYQRPDRSSVRLATRHCNHAAVVWPGARGCVHHPTTCRLSFPGRDHEN